MSPLPTDIRHYLQSASFEEIEDRWEEVLLEAGPKGQDEAQALLGRSDRFYLLTVLLNRLDAKHPWLYARCREVERSPDGHLDLWFREGYKSTIITFAGVIQEVLRDPEITVCIFSHTRPNANKFLHQIKLELESNEDLKRIYSDVLYDRPDLFSPTWSLEKGITVKRQSNPREATIEASGLVDGMPTGSHYKLRVYDDVVTKESVNTPEQVTKTTESYQLSDNLGARGANGMMREWMIGTRYSFADTYQTVLDRKTLKPRVYPATDDGTRTGNPVFLTREALDEKLAKQPSHIFAAQMLQNPAAGTEAMFKLEWLRFSDIRPATLNVYIMVDPAGSKKRGSDNTAISVVGYDAGRTKWLLDGYCHKMGLAERWQRMKELRKHWMETPGVMFVDIGYESYGIPDASITSRSAWTSSETSSRSGYCNGHARRRAARATASPGLSQTSGTASSSCPSRSRKSPKRRSRCAPTGRSTASSSPREGLTRTAGHTHSLTCSSTSTWCSRTPSTMIFWMRPVVFLTWSRGHQIINQRDLEPECFVDGS